MQRLDFNTGWHFSCPDGRDFDVTLPHDAMLNTPRNTEPGFTWFLLAGWRGNDYTYTKNLHITSELIEPSPRRLYHLVFGHPLHS